MNLIKISCIIVSYIIEISPFSVFRLPSQFLFRKSVFTRLTESKTIVEQGSIPSTPQRLIKLFLICLGKFIYQFTPDSSENTVRNKVCFHSLQKFYLVSFVNRIAQFAHLSLYIFALRAFRLFELQFFKHLSHLINQASISLYRLHDVDNSLYTLRLFPELIAHHRLHCYDNIDFTFSRLTSQQSLESTIVITIKSHTRTQIFRHSKRIEAIALYSVHTKAFQLTVIIDKTQSIAIFKAGYCGYVERYVATYLLNLTHKLADSFRCIERSNIRLSPIQEIMGKATIESLLQIRCKIILNMSHRCTAILTRFSFYDCIELTAIGCHHILDVVDIF